MRAQRLARGREQLAQLMSAQHAGRRAVARQRQAPDALGDQASDLFDLIKRADAAIDQRDKDLLVRLRLAPARASRR